MAVNFYKPHVDAAQRMIASAERGFHKAVTALRRLQKDRGFVPQTQNRDCEGAAPKSPKPLPLPLPSRDRKGAVAVGFVSQNPEPALQHSA